MGFEPISQGTVTTDGSEQTILLGTGAGRFSGYIDLSELEAGDTLRVRQYILSKGVYKTYHTEDYSGVQPDPMLYINPKESIIGVNITVQQIAGVFRDFAYTFIIEQILAGASFSI